MDDFKVLRTLVAVYDCGSVVAAARERRYSAAAVSRQMAVLQRRLGLELFVPDGRGIRPTPEAADLVRHVRGVLAQVDELEQHLRSIRSRERVMPSG